MTWLGVVFCWKLSIELKWGLLGQVKDPFASRSFASRSLASLSSLSSGIWFPHFGSTDWLLVSGWAWIEVFGWQICSSWKGGLMVPVGLQMFEEIFWSCGLLKQFSVLQGCESIFGCRQVKEFSLVLDISSMFFLVAQIWRISFEFWTLVCLQDPSVCNNPAMWKSHL